MPFDPDAIKNQYIEQHQDDFNLLSMHTKQIEIAVAYAYPLVKKFLKVVKFDDEQGDEKSIMERVRLYKELKQHSDHLTMLDDSLLDLLDKLESDAPFGIKELESSRKIHTDLDERLEFVLTTQEDALHDGICEANLHRLNPRLIELNRLPHAYNAVLIATSFAAKDFISAAKVHNEAAVAVDEQELELLRKRVVAYKELERHNFILTQASLDFMNTVKRHAEFGKAPKSIIIALLHYFHRNGRDRTRIEKIVVQARLHTHASLVDTTVVPLSVPSNSFIY